MQQYVDIMNRIIDEGEWIHNYRTGKRCKTIINADMEYDFCPLVTTRKSYWKSAVAEFVGYIRGYSNAADFRALGTKTWDANANENKVWLASPYRKGPDDMGRVYGVQGRSWMNWKDGTTIDQLRKVYENLKNGIDDRGEIITFYNPGEFHMGCLRPCVHTHTFSLVNGTLYLTSYQRSNDWPLGCNFNMVQLYFFLNLMAQITGNKPGKVFHKTVNAHIYEDQIELAKVEAAREVYAPPTMTISPDIKTLEDVETVFTTDHVKVEGYRHHEAIAYPFSV